MLLSGGQARDAMMQPSDAIIGPSAATLQSADATTRKSHATAESADATGQPSHATGEPSNATSTSANATSDLSGGKDAGQPTILWGGKFVPAGEEPAVLLDVCLGQAHGLLPGHGVGL